MNLVELLADEALRRREFPVVQDKVFLAHAADCPLSQRVVQAVTDYAQEAAHNDQEGVVFPALLEEGRQLASGLLNCRADEVSFVGPTSLGLSLVASGLKFRRGDNIVIYHDDFPSNVYPWMALAEKGVQVRLLNIRTLGVIRPRDVMGQVDENTRLVALASCHFISGYRLEHEVIGKYLRDRGILFCLDGIQTLGAFPTTVEQVDFLAADAHKWLLGPCGAGILYVRREMQERLTPPLYGWHNVRCPDYLAAEEIAWRSGSKKFEAGSANLLGLAGLVAALKLTTLIGVDEIARELLRKRAWLVPALQDKGYTVLNADVAPQNASGIVTCFRPDTDMAALHERLFAAGIVTSLRKDRQGQQYLRFSPHYYNTDAEIQSAVALL